MSPVVEAREPSAKYLARQQPVLVREFDLLAGAPGSAARLRDLILTLAVQGRLVPQMPVDETALELHARLVAGRCKGERRGSVADLLDIARCDPTTLPCELPAGWAWVRLIDLGKFCGGKTPSKQNAAFWSGSIPWITPKDMKQLRLADSEDHVTEAAVDDGLALIPRNSLLIVVRSGILRRAVPTAINEVETTINQDLKALKLTAPEMAPYLQLLIRGFERFILDTLTKVGTTVESIRFDDFAFQPFPLPPLAEQGRIVARVDELMRLCDALEAKGRLEAEQHARLLSTLLGTLTDSARPEELAANWQRVAEHFDLLLDRPEAVDALEQTVLQLAVRGLLVAHDPSGEPASALLRRMRSEKDRLVAEGKIKLERPLASLDAGEAPFELPASWEWVRLGTIAGVERGGSPRPIAAFLTDSPDGLNWIKIGDTERGGKYITSTSEKIRPDGLSKTRRVFPGDFLLTNSMSFGRPYISQIEGCIHDGWLRISPPNSLNKDYLYLLLSSSFIRVFFEAAAAGGVVQNLNSEKVRRVPIPLPPIGEQARIVARVTELRRLCADLRQRLASAQATQSRLADALVESALA